MVMLLQVGQDLREAAKLDYINHQWLVASVSTTEVC